MVVRIGYGFEKAVSGPTLETNRTVELTRDGLHLRGLVGSQTQGSRMLEADSSRGQRLRTVRQGHKT